MRPRTGAAGADEVSSRISYVIAGQSGRGGVVAHAGESDELRAGDRPGDGEAARGAHERVVEPVHHEGRQREPAERRGAVGLREDRRELAEVAPLGRTAVVARSGDGPQPVVVDGESTRADEPEDAERLLVRDLTVGRGGGIGARGAARPAGSGSRLARRLPVDVMISVRVRTRRCGSPPSAR